MPIQPFSQTLVVPAAPRIQRLLVILLYVANAGQGLVEWLPANELQFWLENFLLPFYVVSVATTWMATDVRQHRSFIPHSWYLPICLAIALVLPIWLIWSRRLKGLGLCLLHVVGLLLAQTAGYKLGSILVRGPQVWFQSF